MIIAIVIMVAIVGDLFTGAEIFKSIISIRRGGRILGVATVVIIYAFVILWKMRRVTVYTDRVEVRHPFHPSRDYTIDMQQVDCLCVEYYRKGENVPLHRRMMMLSDGMLRLYITDEECANYNDMMSVMTDFFGLSCYEKDIHLSYLEKDKIRSGHPISFNVIPESELIKIRRQRDEKLCSNNSGWVSTNPQKHEIYGWKNLLIVIVIPAILFGASKMLYLYESSITVTCSIVDKTIELPDKAYLKADTIDADVKGRPYMVKLQGKVNSKGDTANKVLVYHWAFPIKGRKDLWVAFKLQTGCNDNITLGNQRQYLKYCLLARQRYAIVKPRTLGSSIQIEICHNIPNILSPEYITVLQHSDDDLLLGEPLFAQAMEAWDRKQYKRAIPRLIINASFGHSDSSERLGEAYMHGMGVDKDLEESIKYYKDAIKQTSNIIRKANLKNELSYVYSEKKQYDKAIEIIDQAIQLNPMEANFYDSKGEHLFMAGDKRQAKEMWKKVIELDPHFLEKHTSNLHKLLLAGSDSPQTLYIRNQQEKKR